MNSAITQDETLEDMMLIYIGVSVVVLVTCLGCVTQLQRTEHFLSLFQRMKAYLTLVSGVTSPF